MSVLHLLFDPPMTKFTYKIYSIFPSQVDPCVYPCSLGLWIIAWLSFIEWIISTYHIYLSGFRWPHSRWFFFSSSTHLTANFMMPFFFPNSWVMCHIFFISFSVESHLGCFWFLAIVNTAPVNMTFWTTWSWVFKMLIIMYLLALF